MRSLTVCLIALIPVCLLLCVRCEDHETPEPLDDNRKVNADEVLRELIEKERSNVYFFETFDENSKTKQSWVRSQAKKEGTDEDIAKYDGVWSMESVQKDTATGVATYSPLDLGLVLKSEARHAAIGSPLWKPFKFQANGKPLIVQYEVQFQDGMDCGGGYLKLLSRGNSQQTSTGEMLKMFHDKTLYSIMFGPDKCGSDTKLHFIFQYRNPKNGTIMEKHCEKPVERFDEVFSDKFPHFFKLELQSNSNFKLFIDNKEVISGSLLDKFSPPVNPPKEIDDPNDKKPSDWDERPKISDPDATKPDDWDESEPEYVEDVDAVKPTDWLDDEELLIADETAEKPEDWEDDTDGDWESPKIPNPKCAANNHCGEWKRPQIKNPKYKGKWSSPMIDNPNYKGKWKARRIPNPDYYEDRNPFEKLLPIDAVGFELWSMSKNILFDNILITSSDDVSQSVKQNTFDLKIRRIDESSNSLWGRFMKSIKFKLNWWIAYAIFLSIPISLYVAYLIKRALDHDHSIKSKKNPNSVVDQVISITNQYPWLWAVYVLVSGILVSLLVYCCRKSPSVASEKPQEDEPLVPKSPAKERIRDSVSVNGEHVSDHSVGHSDESDSEIVDDNGDDMEIIENKSNSSDVDDNITMRKRKARKSE